MQLFGLILAALPPPGQRQDMSTVYAKVTAVAELCHLTLVFPRWPRVRQAVGGKAASPLVQLVGGWIDDTPISTAPI